MHGNRPLVVLLGLIALGGVVYTLKESQNPERVPLSEARSRIVMVGGYPELHVDGQPFFMHSAAFYYYRLPRDRWEESLDRMLAHGINTLDIYVPWNWHEPDEGALDFDGRTSPRRDLRGLLDLVASRGTKVVLRPGPFICSEWRNGGYPDWLLGKRELQDAFAKENQMPLRDILEGRYARVSALQYERSEEAAVAYVSNPVHLRYTRKWYEDVMEVARPHLASRGGPVILLQLDDDQGLDPQNYNGPRFWEYLDVLRRYLREAARDATIPVLINPADMRVTASSSTPSFGGPFWAMGQYYQEEGIGPDVLRSADAGRAKYLTEILKTQPGFPPFFIEYQAGWFIGPDDVRARQTDPTNTLLSSRFLFGNGVKGINYFPLEDTLFPAGYECPWSNYFYTWESAIGYAGELRARAQGSLRNGSLIRGMGRLLAASHYVSDIGIVHPIGSYPQTKLTRDDVQTLVQRTRAALQYAAINQVSAELVDVEYQSLEQIRRYPLLLFPSPSAASYRDGKLPEYMVLSPRARSILKRYVEEGGHLVAYPVPPGGELPELFPIAPESSTGSDGFQPVRVDGTAASTPGPVVLYKVDRRAEPFAALGASPNQITGYRRPYGKGEAIVLGAQFDRWVPLQSGAASLPPSSDGPPAPAVGGNEKETRQIMEALLRHAGVARVVGSSELERGAPAEQPSLALLVANGAGPGGRGNAYGFFSIVNFGTHTADFQPDLRDPRDGRPWKLPVIRVAPRDALLLPLRIGLANPLLGLGREASFDSSDEIVYSTAEVTAVRASPGALLIDLYSRADATLALRLTGKLAGEPTIGSQSGRFRIADENLYTFDIPSPRDAGGIQTLKIPYQAVRGSTGAIELRGGRVELEPTIEIPVRSDTRYGLWPATQTARVGERIGFSFRHPAGCRGKCTATISAGDLKLSAVDAEKRPAFTVEAPHDRLYIRELEWTFEGGGETHRGTGRVVFFPTGSAIAFERDVDRDGLSDYVLENEKVRLVVSPHAGARSFAFIRKDTGTSAFTSIGGLRDLFRLRLPDAPGDERLPGWTRVGIPGMHNRAYQGRVLQESGSVAEVSLAYDAPDVAPRGALLERRIRLGGTDGFFDVTYSVTAREAATDQGYVNLNSLALGSMDDPAATILASDSARETQFQKGAKGTIEGASWVALRSRDGKELAGMSWRRGDFVRVAWTRRDASLELRLESPLWGTEKSRSYRVRYLYDADTPQARRALEDGARRPQ